MIPEYILKNIPALIHPPRTGGTSLRNAIIEKYGPDALPGRKDRQGRGIKPGDWNKHSRLEQLDIDEDRNVVMLVRNPYERYFSMYQFNKGKVGNPEPFEFFKLMMRGQLFTATNQSLKENNHHSMGTWHHPRVSDIIRYETYAEDIKRVYDININEYKHINKTNNRTNIAALIDQKTLDLLNYLSMMDFYDFGYERLETVQQVKRAFT